MSMRLVSTQAGGNQLELVPWVTVPMGQGQIVNARESEMATSKSTEPKSGVTETPQANPKAGLNDEAAQEAPKPVVGPDNPEGIDLAAGAKDAEPAFIEGDDK
jgi:hypothetical protein